jgi:hypothetical protein
MKWRRSVTGEPLFLQMFDDPAPLDLGDSQIVERLYELAEFVAYKAFCLMGVDERDRRRHREDAIQEAIVVLCQYAHLGARCAYGIARRRLIHWLITYVYGGQPRKHNQPVYLPPRAVSLDAFEREPLHIVQRAGNLTPEEVLLERETLDEREASVQAMYSIVHDLIVNCIRPQRRLYATAHLDATVFQYTLRGDGWKTMVVEMGWVGGTARQRIRFARARLAQHLEQNGVENVAARYAGSAARTIGDAAAELAYIKTMVKQRLAAHCQRTGRFPHQRTVQKWAAQARREWAARWTGGR